MARLEQLDAERAALLARLRQLDVEEAGTESAPRRTTPSRGGVRIRWVGA
jgi:hypothetical protein